MLSLAMFRNLSISMMANRKAECVVADFPEYATEVGALSSAQTAQIRALAVRVFASLSTPRPYRGIVVVGHADVALRVAVAQRAAFETDVSLKRAESGRKVFEAALTKLAGHPSVKYMVCSKVFGMGSAHRLVLHPQNEQGHAQEPPGGVLPHSAGHRHSQLRLCSVTRAGFAAPLTGCPLLVMISSSRRPANSSLRIVPNASSAEPGRGP